MPAKTTPPGSAVARLADALGTDEFKALHAAEDFAGVAEAERAVGSTHRTDGRDADTRALPAFGRVSRREASTHCL